MATLRCAAAATSAEPLDGEFWIDRKKFQRTVGIVRRQDKNDLWKEVRFRVFDAPEDANPFEKRMQTISAHHRRRIDQPTRWLTSKSFAAISTICAAN